MWIDRSTDDLWSSAGKRGSEEGPRQSHPSHHRADHRLPPLNAFKRLVFIVFIVNYLFYVHIHLKMDLTPHIEEEDCSKLFVVPGDATLLDFYRQHFDQGTFSLIYSCYTYTLTYKFRP